MRETYVKRGQTVRFEIAGGGVWSTRISEWGSAESDGRAFVARSIGKTSDEPLPLPSLPASLITRIESFPSGVEIERATLAMGASHHEIRRGRIRKTWQEQAVRVHVALVRRTPPARVFVDLGAPSVAELRLEDLDTAADALAHLRHGSGPRQTNLILEPLVAARLWPEIHRLARAADLGSGRLILRQNEHSWQTTDGRGEPVNRVDVLDSGKKLLLASTSLPNVFRPSYRFPPRRVPFNLGAALEGSVEESGVRGIAPAGDVVIRDGRLVIALLCSFENETFVERLAGSCQDWLSAIASVTGAMHWYPFGAGSLGQCVGMEGASLTQQV